MNEISALIPENTPIIDWEKALYLADGKEDLAKLILKMFIDSLPASLSIINTYLKQNEYKLLGDELHKMLGGCGYAGATRLQVITRNAETVIKQQNLTNIEVLIDFVNQEAVKVLNEYANFNHKIEE